jgi:hypothetical protein
MPPLPKKYLSKRSSQQSSGQSSTSLQEKVAHVKRARQDRQHGCHWPGCTAQVPPAMWGCTRHWYMLPKHLRDRIWAEYRPGQEEDMKPSIAYIANAQAAQDWIKYHHPELFKYQEEEE